MPASKPWAAVVSDPVAGAVPLVGQFRHRESETLVVLLHGLGGSQDSIYVRQAAGVVDAAGMACLRLTARGSDGSGADIYHGGLTADLRAALASPEVEGLRKSS